MPFGHGGISAVVKADERPGGAVGRRLARSPGLERQGVGLRRWISPVQPRLARVISSGIPAVIRRKNQGSDGLFLAGRTSRNGRGLGSAGKLALQQRFQFARTRGIINRVKRQRRQQQGGQDGGGVFHGLPLANKVAMSVSIRAFTSAGRRVRPVYSSQPLETPTPAPTWQASFICAGHIFWKCQAHGRHGLSPSAAR